MNRAADLDIDRLAITLTGASATFGRAVADRLGDALQAALARRPGPGRLRAADIDRIDLGAIDAPANSDAAAIAALIAARLGDWLSANGGDDPQETR